MKALEEKIRREGTVLPGNILKVGSFLNHQLDVDFLMEMGREIARKFEGDGVTKILTIETSGIAVAMAAAAAMHVPVVFGKKHKTGNLSGEMYSTVVHSYTHGTDYTVVMRREYLGSGDVVLLGSLRFMQLMGVYMHEGTKVKIAVYLSINGEMCAVFALNYAPSGKVRRGLRQIVGAGGLTPVFATGISSLRP